MLRITRVFCLLLLLLAVTTVSHAEDTDFAASFQKAKTARDDKAAETALDDWKHARPDDPEYFIAAANYVLAKGSRVEINAGNAAPGEFAVSDSRTGQQYHMSEGPTPAARQQAVDLLKEAISKAPARIDIYLGLATLYEQSGDAGAVVKELSEMAAYAKAHNGALFYQNGEPYPEPADENLSRAISNFAGRYFKLETKAGDKAFHDLAQLDIDAFPNREYGYNLLGAYYGGVEKNLKLALENYQHALTLVPDDSIVLNNVGVVHRMAGQKKEAIATFKKVIALNNDPGCVKQAKAELAKLK